MPGAARAGPSWTSRANRCGPSPNATSPTSRSATSWACCAPSTMPPAPPSARTPAPWSRRRGWTTAPRPSWPATRQSSLEHRPRLAAVCGIVAGQGPVRSHLRTAEQAGLAPIPVNASRRSSAVRAPASDAAAASEGKEMTGSARTERPGAPLYVDAATLGRVAAGEHHAPHSVLGAHLDDHGHVTIRTVKHLARSRHCRHRGRFRSHDPRDPAASGWPSWNRCEHGHVPDYRLEVVLRDHEPQTIDDPYRYLPTVGEVDLHLIGEGRHERLWDVLGSHVQHYQLLARRRGRRVLRRLGAQRTGRPRQGRLQLPGTAGNTPCARSGLQRRLGSLHPGRCSRGVLQIRALGPRPAIGWRRPTRSPSAPKFRR